MKKLIILFIAFSLFSCNDGDFDVPAFEFTETVNSCGEYILYIKNSNSTETLVLTLNSSDLGTTEGETSFEIPTNTTVTYRIFKEGIGETYFCQDIPPATPHVLKELTATSGTVTILTTLESTDNYSYTINISELLFDDNNERIFFENLSFGIFTLSF